MKKIALLIIIALLATAVTFVTSCEQAGKSPSQKKLKKESTEKVKSKNQTSGETTTVTDNEGAGALSLTLYFANEQGDKLVKEVRSVSETDAVAAAAIEQLIVGPAETGHFSTIPKSTRLLGISIRDRVAYVDFSREFLDNAPGGSSGEIMTIFSVVNTLTEFPTIASVRFLVDGREITTIAGHYDLSEPVKRDESLIALP